MPEYEDDVDPEGYVGGGDYWERAVEENNEREKEEREYLAKLVSDIDDPSESASVIEDYYRKKLEKAVLTDTPTSPVLSGQSSPKSSDDLQSYPGQTEDDGPAYLTASPPGSNSWTLDASATSTPAPAHWEQSPTSSTFQSGAEASTCDGQEPTTYQPSSDDTYSPDEYSGGATSFANTTAVQPSGPPPSSP